MAIFSAIVVTPLLPTPQKSSTNEIPMGFVNES
jgi:hypothetical protein